MKGLTKFTYLPVYRNNVAIDLVSLHDRDSVSRADNRPLQIYINR